MIQQINLYQPQTKKALSFSFWFVFKTVFILTAFLFLVSLYEAYQYVRTKKILLAFQSEYRQALTELEKTRAKIPGPEVKEGYLGKIRKLETDQKIKKDMLSVLTTLQITQTLGFSRYLSALAAQTSNGIWLTHFKFAQDKNAIALEGVSIKPDHVSHLMDRLSQEPIFTGKTFQVFKLVIDANTNYINFELSTEKEKKEEQRKS